MTQRYRFTPARLRHAAVVGSLAALTATVAITPAHAAEGTIIEVATGAEFVDALDAASSATEATTITLTADIQLPAVEEPTYTGAHNLIIDGAGHTVTPDAPDYSYSVLYVNTVHDVDVTITNITVESFELEASAILMYSGESLTVTNSRFVNNGLPDADNHVIEVSVPLVVQNSEFIGNASDYYGTAIESWDSLVIENSTFDSNVTTGTVIEVSGDDVRISGTTFSNNSAPDDAVIYIEADDPIVIENSTFTNNEADDGVLWMGSNSSIFVAQSTFSNNDVGGDAYAAHISLASDTELMGNVFTGATGGPGCFVGTDVTVLSHYNFDADGTCTDGWADATNIGDGLDAQLGALANNGGATQTLLPATGSPLIDAIPLAAGSPVSADQRGIHRPQGDGYDIGAVEVEAAEEDDADAGLVAFQVKTDAGTLYGTASPAIAVTDINWTSTANLTGAPANTALPYGAAGFTVQVPEPGDSVTITLTAPAPFTTAYKVTNGQWANIEGATFSADGTTITYTLTDGGELDEDGEANGFIVDPIALAVEATFTG